MASQNIPTPVCDLTIYLEGSVQRLPALEACLYGLSQIFSKSMAWLTLVQELDIVNTVDEDGFKTPPLTSSVNMKTQQTPLKQSKEKETRNERTD
ncbi:hypothetical protein GLOIN_2v1487478 [Rhizophagus clarus]|uniref:Uncharacterized protein n=1 Tax=Rhizophagus clarus TaxID=94130 RepID=A0A8H3LEX3_9GLOM|nr:hypothetical protein GLOIN_2v1487478 [Rhizophagus clarus]